MVCRLFPFNVTGAEAQDRSREDSAGWSRGGVESVMPANDLLLHGSKFQLQNDLQTLHCCYIVGRNFP